MASLYYSSTAIATSLTGGVTNSAPTLAVGAVTGFPTSFPYKLIVDRGTASEEAVRVTGASGTNLTVVRGIDGTSAVSHSAGATVEHGVTGQDFQDARNHLDASSGVHGITGSVVGTSDTQTLTNKTLESPSINDAALDTPFITDYTNAPHTHLNAVNGGQLTKAALSDFPHTHLDAANGNKLDYAAITGTGTNFNPTVTGSTSNPAFTTVGRYIQIGKLVHFWFRITYTGIGNMGSGSYSVSLPVAARATPVLNAVGVLRFGDASSNPNIIAGACLVAPSGTTLTGEFNDASAPDANVWGSSWPNIPTSGSTVDGFVTYEAA